MVGTGNAQERRSQARQFYTLAFLGTKQGLLFHGEGAFLACK